MRFASAIIFCTLCCTFPSAIAQQKAVKISAAQSDAASPTRSDVQELRKDLEKMRAIVQQMEANLAFVDTTQSPLKHQFQLEIDMWRAVIGQMERRLNASSAP
jgi:septal ring factor EnvC (AmiA/AmiB activator)